MNRLSNRQNPVVARFRAAAHNEDRAVVLLDGPHLVAEAIAAGITIEHAIISSADASRPDIAGLVRSLEQLGVDISGAPSAVMSAVSPVRSASPIVALASRPADVRGALFTPAHPLVVVACGVQDPGNIGAIIRVAEAAGATACVAAGPSADPFAWKALRGSMGSTLRMPISVEHDEAGILAEARERSCRLVAAVPRGGRSLFDVPLTGRIAILVGGEGPGLTAASIASADERVTIPMAPPVESLNTAVSAALILYEAARQRR